MTVATRDQDDLGAPVEQNGWQAGLTPRRADNRQLRGGRGALGASSLATRAPIAVPGTTHAASRKEAAARALPPPRDPAFPRFTERRFVRDVTAPMPPQAPMPVVARTTAPATAITPQVRRLKPDEDRRYGSFAIYLTMLVASAAAGVLIAWLSCAPAVRYCTGGDMVGACIKDKVFAPAITSFALVLAVGLALTTLVVDVLPDARRKRRAGYRLRQDRRPPPPRRTSAPPLPADLLAVACWSPAQGGGTVDRASAAAALRAVRAVCPGCATVVTARAGACLQCGGAVVTRRG